MKRKKGRTEMRMTSRYPGSCTICGRRFSAGTEIDYDKATRSAAHLNCKQTEAPIPEGTKTYLLGGGSGYGCTGWKQGQIVHSSQRDIEQRGYPAYLCVLRTVARYVREDGMSFGVGDESGHLYTATCREATIEESAPLIAAERHVQTVKQAKVQLEELKRQVRDSGEKPVEKDQILIGGERLFDTQSIYGGGDWFELTPEHVWYIRNNGSDGDDWSANNVRTGGAGAMGWRVPRTQQLAEVLNALRQLLGTTIEDEDRERQLLAMASDARLVCDGD